jgi:hypothetical protein
MRNKIRENLRNGSPSPQATVLLSLSLLLLLFKSESEKKLDTLWRACTSAPASKRSRIIPSFLCCEATHSALDLFCK